MRASNEPVIRACNEHVIFEALHFKEKNFKAFSSVFLK